MLDSFQTLAANIVIISLLILLLKLFKKVDIFFKWSFWALALAVSHLLALDFGGSIIPIKLIYPDANYNWGGKLLAIALWGWVLFLLIKTKRDFTPEQAGFTLKQNIGSTKPATIAFILIVLFQIIICHLAGENGGYDAEELLFQGLMPGLDEEPIFRGVLLYLLSLAVTSKRIAVFGAHVNIAGLVIAIFFGLAHGLWKDAGEWHFSLFSASLTALYGVIFLWLREKTGSLLFPIIAHNSVNFAGQFQFDF